MPLAKVAAAQVEYDQHGTGPHLLLIHSLLTELTVFALALAIRHGERFGKLIVADALATFPEPARVPFRVMAEKVATGGMQEVLDTAIGRMFPPAFAQAHPNIIAERKAKLGGVDPQCF